MFGNHRRTLLALAMAALVLLAGSLTACTQPGTSSTTCGNIDATGVTSIAVIQGNRQNTLTTPPAQVLCFVERQPQAALHGVIIIPDGIGHRVAWEGRWTPDPEHPKSEKLALGEFQRGFADALAAPATQPEANQLEAVVAAAKALRSDTGRRLLVINDSLVQTTGRLPLQNGYLYADTAAVTDELRGFLDQTSVDLTGVEVVLMASGTAAGTQGELDTETQAKLVGLWTAVLASRGATVTEYTGRHFEPVAARDLPEVSAVVFKAPEPPSIPCAARLGEEKVGFVPDSTAFIDPAAARDTITRVAGELAACRGELSVIGTTASGGDAAYRKRLSQGRAEAVRTLLAEVTGRPADTIPAIGVGMDSEYYIHDRRPDGSMDAVTSQLNRSVIVLVR